MCASEIASCTVCSLAKRRGHFVVGMGNSAPNNAS
jgi:uracil-DNA glycosylase